MTYQVTDLTRKQIFTKQTFIEYTDMSMSQIMQRQSIHYSGNLTVLRHLLTQVAGLLETLEGDKKIRAFNAIDITIDNKMVVLEVINNSEGFCCNFCFSGLPILLTICTQTQSLRQYYKLI